MPRPTLAALPIDPYLPEIHRLVRTHRALVLVAEPGAGKTTRVAPALLPLGRTILLQPRRIAARSLARRIASEQGWSPGEEVGWQVRLERVFNERTRLVVATEGILTARLVDDPLLEGFGVVIVDELHERTIDADLGLALSRQAMLARDDLHVVAMSATIDPAPVAAFLGGCPVLEVPGRAHPIALSHAPLSVAAAVRQRLSTATGDLLCFLPGAGEIRRTMIELSGIDADLFPLHGALDAEEQDRALAPSPRRKVILATNVAETSITVDGVTDVIDSGRVKVLRFDPGKGIDRLEAERVSQDSADQRAGRAGRTGPGRALRLWDERDVLAAHREPEVCRVDLAPAFLHLLAWGADPATFSWLEPPARDAADRAFALLRALGAAEGQKLTATGSILRRIPLHPRLGRIVIAASGDLRAVAACAAISEGRGIAWEPITTDSDLLLAADAVLRSRGRHERLARKLHRIARSVLGGRGQPLDDAALRRAILAGYPDRLAVRRDAGSRRYLLSSGHGAVLGAESGVRDAELIVAVDLVAAGTEARIRACSAIDRAWIAADRTVVVHEIDARGKVRAFARSFSGEIAIGERAAPVDPGAALPLLIAFVKRRGLGDADRETLRRLAFAGIAIDLDALVAASCAGRTEAPDASLAELLPGDVARRLGKLAPARITLPSGREAPLDYPETGGALLAVKVQELFGLPDSPRIGARNEPVTLSLLAPNGRPIQTTRDLRSFWSSTYKELRSQLRGRYPKHRWPEDPWTAAPGPSLKRRRA
ncbi:MAG: ATP-dependent helicase C-terminal domain-containing protein [Acidobacteriota bacterium]